MMLQAQPHHLDYPLQQQQQNYVLTSTTPHHHLTSASVLLTHQPSTLALTSNSAFKPQPLPVPVTRNSFRIDDILGEQRARRVDTSRRVSCASTRKLKECQLTTSTDHKRLRQNNDREVTERPLTNDSSHPYHHLHHHQNPQLQQHGGSEMAQQAGHVDPVDHIHRGSSSVAKRRHDSTPDHPSRHHHDTQSTASRPTVQQDRMARPPVVSGVRRIPLEGNSDECDRLSPSMLLHNATPASHPLHLTLHHHPQHQQHQQQYGQFAENTAATVFGPLHPLLAVPTSSSLISSLSLDPLSPLHSFFTGRHDAFLAGCEFSCFVHFYTILN